MERRKESIPKSPSPKKEMVSKITQLPITVNVKSTKTANKPRKGLPAFIWVIGNYKKIVEIILFLFAYDFNK